MSSLKWLIERSCMIWRHIKVPWSIEITYQQELSSSCFTVFTFHFGNLYVMSKWIVEVFFFFSKSHNCSLLISTVLTLQNDYIKDQIFLYMSVKTSSVRTMELNETVPRLSPSQLPHPRLTFVMSLKSRWLMSSLEFANDKCGLSPDANVVIVVPDMVSVVSQLFRRGTEIVCHVEGGSLWRSRKHVFVLQNMYD